MAPLRRLRRALTPSPPSPTYQPITSAPPSAPAFSPPTYTTFLLLGISMLWPWNTFLAASAYFLSRLSHSPHLLQTFQPTLISLSALTNLVSMLVLTRLHARANYPLRIAVGLVLQTGAFAALAASTLVGRGVAEGVYFAFLMAVVLVASLATGVCQNAVFAFVAGYGRAEYTQAIMTGQAVAGVLPCVAQIAAVLVAGGRDAKGMEEGGENGAWAACGYFLVAAGVSVGALGAFAWLLRGRGEGMGAEVMDGGAGDEDEDERDRVEEGPDADERERKAVGLWTLLSKLRWLVAAVFTCFALTMLYPVFTQKILSVRPADAAPPLLRPACFIPLAFLLWNAGDLTGRIVTLLPPLSLTRYPRALFAISLARLGFVPLYLLCNIRGRGAVVGGDVFYLVGVQFLFGITNGYLGSSCMMGAAEWVEVEEREAAGGFMGLMLVGGLTAGSLLSFLVAGI